VLPLHAAAISARYFEHSPDKHRNEVPQWWHSVRQTQGKPIFFTSCCACGGKNIYCIAIICFVGGIGAFRIRRPHTHKVQIADCDLKLVDVMQSIALA